MWTPRVWYAIPSANPARAQSCLAKWRARGYKTAVFLDAGVGGVDADLVVSAEYPGYFAAVNLLAHEIGEQADILVTGGDDIFPDERHTAVEIGREFYARFPDGFGVMQPIGDPLPGTDRICGSPWLGRGWLTRAYGGAGPLHPNYIAFFGDEELHHVAKLHGCLWQRPDLVQHHAHYSREGGPPIESYQMGNQRYWAADGALCAQRRAVEWDGSGPLSPVRLSILICTLESRREWYNRLLDNLCPQVSAAQPWVEVLVDTDRGERSIGAKRQSLLDRARGVYIAYIDDDDLVADDYIKRVLSALSTGPDCVGLRGIITTDGACPATFEHSLRHAEWYTADGVHYRCPNHLNPVRRDLALRAGFPDLSHGEDSAYSHRLRPHLSTEVFVEAPLYLYEYRTHK